MENKNHCLNCCNCLTYLTPSKRSRIIVTFFSMNYYINLVWFYIILYYKIDYLFGYSIIFIITLTIVCFIFSIRQSDELFDCLLFIFWNIVIIINIISIIVLTIFNNDNINLIINIPDILLNFISLLITNIAYKIV